MIVYNLCHVSDAIYGVLGPTGLQVPAAPMQMHLNSSVAARKTLRDHHGWGQVDLN